MQFLGVVVKLQCHYFIVSRSLCAISINEFSSQVMSQAISQASHPLSHTNQCSLQYAKTYFVKTLDRLPQPVLGDDNGCKWRGTF